MREVHYPISTNKIRAHELDIFLWEDVISWANEMVDSGFESEGLFVLCGIQGGSREEIEPYLLQTLEELGLQSYHGNAAIVSFASYYIYQILNEINVKHNLAFLFESHLKLDFPSDTHDFSLLHCAWDQLDYDKSGGNHYWPDFTKENAMEKTVQAAKDWLAEHRTVHNNA